MTGHLEKSFNKKNEKVKKVTEITYFKRLDQRRIICDAGKKDLGALLQQNEKNGNWKPIAYASKFRTDFRANFSIKELEFLSVVGSVDHLKTYVYGTKFQIVSGHKALKRIKDK